MAISKHTGKIPVSNPGTTNVRTAVAKLFGDGIARKQQSILTVGGSSIGPSTSGSKESMTVTGTNGITGVVTTTPAVSEALSATFVNTSGAVVTTPASSESMTGEFVNTSGVQTTTAAVAEVPRVGITGTTAGSDAGGTAAAEDTSVTVNLPTGTPTASFTNSFETDIGLNQDVKCAHSAGGITILGTEYGAIYSLNLSTGDTTSIGSFTGTFVDVTQVSSNSDGSLWVIIDKGGKVWTSTDPTTLLSWVARQDLAVNDGGNTGRRLIFDGTNFVFATTTGDIYTSSDPTSSTGWTQNTSVTETEKFTSVYHSSAESITVAAGTNGTIWVASDVTGTWTDKSLTTIDDFTTIGYDGTTWLVMGQDGYTATSPTGTWSQTVTFPSTSVNYNIITVGNTWGITSGYDRKFYSISSIADATSASSWTEEFSFTNLYYGGNGLQIGNNILLLGTIGIDYITSAAGALSQLSLTFGSTFSSTPVTTGDIVAETSAVNVAALLRTALNNAITAGTLTGYTVTAASTAVVDVVASSTGARQDIVALYTGVTNGVTVNVATQGSDGTVANKDAYTMNAGSPHSPSSLASTFPNDTLSAGCRTIIRDHIINGDIGGYGSVTAIGANSYFEMTSNTAGAETDFALAITPGTGSDLAAVNSVTTQGADAFTTGTLDTCTLTARGVTKSFTITSGSTSTSQYTQAYNYFSSTDPITGVTISGSGSTLGVTSTATGNETDYTLTVTSNGTAGSPTVTNTNGTDETSTGSLDTCTIVARGVTKTLTFTTGSSSSSQYTQVYNYLVANAITGVTAAGSGSTLTLTSTDTGVETDYTLTVTSNGTAGSPTISRTQGAAQITSGTLSSWTAVVDGTTYTENYTSGADSVKQLSEPKDYLVSQSVDASISGTTMTVNSATNGNKTDFTFTLGLGGTSQTATQPTVSNTNGAGSESNFTITVTGGGVDTSVTYSNNSTMTKTQFLTALNTAIDNNVGVFTYQDGGGDLEFASNNDETYPDVVVTVSNNTGDITITPTTKYKGYS